MAPYGETDFEKGVLYGLAHDVPAMREAIATAVTTALKDINKGPSHFTDGRRYPLQLVQGAVTRTIAELEEEIRQRE